jgi:hypothetical protein
MSVKDNNKPVLIFGLCIIFLIALSYFPKDLTILGYRIKQFDLFIDIKPDSLISQNHYNGNTRLDHIRGTSGLYLANVYGIMADNFLRNLKQLDLSKGNDHIYKGIPQKDIQLTGNFTDEIFLCSIKEFPK